MLGFNLESIELKMAKLAFEQKPRSHKERISGASDLRLVASSIEADDVVDLRTGSNLLFVYTDIIKPVQVGDTAAPLLRSLPIVADNGQCMYTDRFIRPYYFPIQRTYINDIFVYINDENGEKVEFGKLGRLQLVLHFRRKD